MPHFFVLNPALIARGTWPEIALALCGVLGHGGRGADGGRLLRLLPPPAWRAVFARAVRLRRAWRCWRRTWSFTLAGRRAGRLARNRSKCRSRAPGAARGGRLIAQMRKTDPMGPCTPADHDFDRAPRHRAVRPRELSGGDRTNRTTWSPMAAVPIPGRFISATTSARPFRPRTSSSCSSARASAASRSSSARPAIPAANSAWTTRYATCCGRSRSSTTSRNSGSAISTRKSRFA